MRNKAEGEGKPGDDECIGRATWFGDGGAWGEEEQIKMVSVAAIFGRRERAYCSARIGRDVRANAKLCQNMPFVECLVKANAVLSMLLAAIRETLAKRSIIRACMVDRASDPTHSRSPQAPRRSLFQRLTYCLQLTLT